MKNIKQWLLPAAAILAALLTVLFCIARFSWRIFGDRYCLVPSAMSVETARINQIAGTVTVSGTTASSADAYVGCIWQESDGVLTLSVKYNTLLGFFRRDGSFQVEIPADTAALEQIVISGGGETQTVWKRQKSY